MTGTASRIIHSDLLPESRSISTVFSRLMMSLIFCLDSVRVRSSRSVSLSRLRSRRRSSSRTASAPMPAWNAIPYFWRDWRNSSSLRSCSSLSGVSPASMTM